jgi:hypothetical protein
MLHLLHGNLAHRLGLHVCRVLRGIVLRRGPPSAMQGRADHDRTRLAVRSRRRVAESQISVIVL